MVQAVAYSNFRKDLKSYMRKVNEDADLLLITNPNPDDNVVVMSADDYESLMETMRIYQNPYLHKKITKGLQQVRDGSVRQYSLIDPDAEDSYSSPAKRNGTEG
ncbi:type II toxin-antitoxin system prevent-host-death family antitoxin [Bifidobacterium sp. ESL0775]|uniref:type II toxin-antitoxin system Phd/YefM family antitoxin n=1 Tax=Bifidobacterium sp. ESL0775 TaxID=2983230 RepID=UPI0023F9953A|nr:type II toxin-antitoxin system prevent-host-death family antitoxin [Bifidobacterium sp. ESL0775]WEV69461.1 type II toxin-antitoxin system prevent-host-death family antitoxin [Bifidobacterium sp. ESL0775]